MLIRQEISRQKEGRYAGPINRLSTSTGTMSRIFSFNEFARTVGLKEPVQSAEGTGLSKENLASILPYLASAFRSF